MRMLLRVSIQWKPESWCQGWNPGSYYRANSGRSQARSGHYFFADDNGNRSGSIVFEMKDTSQIPANAEPLVPDVQCKGFFPGRSTEHLQDLATAGPSDYQKRSAIREVGRT